MYSDKFRTFIEMWQKEFAIERSIDEKVCLDRDGNPIPWYTYPAIEYLSQFDYSFIVLICQVTIIAISSQ